MNDEEVLKTFFKKASDMGLGWKETAQAVGISKATLHALVHKGIKTKLTKHKLEYWIKHQKTLEINRDKEFWCSQCQNIFSLEKAEWASWMCKACRAVLNKKYRSRDDIKARRAIYKRKWQKKNRSRYLAGRKRGYYRRTWGEMAEAIKIIYSLKKEILKRI